MNQKSAPQVSCPEPVILFILGSPRVGSTVLFQLVINHFECFFPSNSFNRIFQNKEVNLESLDLSPYLFPLENVSYNSDYGKTLHEGEPSEASAFFATFFGGVHPSEEKSKSILIANIVSVGIIIIGFILLGPILGIIGLSIVHVVAIAIESIILISNSKKRSHDERK